MRWKKVLTNETHGIVGKFAEYQGEVRVDVVPVRDVVELGR